MLNGCLDVLFARLFKCTINGVHVKIVLGFLNFVFRNIEILVFEIVVSTEKRCSITGRLNEHTIF